MIALSWLFLLAAIGTLLVGVFNDLVWVYVSIGASVLAMILLLAGIVRRKPVQPATAGAPYGPPVGEAAARGRAAAATAVATAPARAGARRRPATPKAPTAPARKPAAKKPAAKKTAARKTTAKKAASRKPAAKKTTAKKTAAAGASTRATVVAIPERGTYHQSGCRFVKGRRDTERIQLTTAKSRGYSACGVCKP